MLFKNLLFRITFRRASWAGPPFVRYPLSPLTSPDKGVMCTDTDSRFTVWKVPFMFPNNMVQHPNQHSLQGKKEIT